MSSFRNLLQFVILLAPCLAKAVVIFEAGVPRPPEKIEVGGNLILSVEDDGAWNIWDREASKVIDTAGPNNFPYRLPRLAGNTLLKWQDGATVVFDATTGRKTAEFRIPDAIFNLTRNGSHVWAATTGTVRSLWVWTASGDTVLYKVGTFGIDDLLVEDGVVHIRSGRTINRYQSSQGGDSLPPVEFLGSFVGWLADGRGFITTQPGLVRVQALDGAELDMRIVDDRTFVQGGTRSRLWLQREGRQEIHHIGGEGPPFILDSIGADFKSPKVYVTPSAFFAVKGTEARVADLRGDSLRLLTLPLREGFSTLTADSSGNWVAGGDGGYLEGGILGGAPRAYAPGGVTGFAGSLSGRFAFADAAGFIRIYDRQGDSAVLRARLEIRAGGLRITPDGRFLALQQKRRESQRSDTVRVYSLEAKDPALVWSRGTIGTSQENFDISDDASRIGIRAGDTAMVLRRDDDSVLARSHNVNSWSVPLVSGPGQEFFLDSRIYLGTEQVAATDWTPVGRVAENLIFTSAGFMAPRMPSWDSTCAVDNHGRRRKDIPCHAFQTAKAVRISDSTSLLTVRDNWRILSQDLYHQTTGKRLISFGPALQAAPAGDRHMLLYHGTRVTLESYDPEKASPVLPHRPAGRVLAVGEALSDGGLRFRFHLPAAGPVKAEAFDAKGKRLAFTRPRVFGIGSHQITLGSQDIRGGALSAGPVYFRLSIPGVREATGRILPAH